MDSLGYYSIEFFFVCFYFSFIVFCVSLGFFLLTSGWHHEGLISWFSWLSLLGGKYTKKLIIVLDAGTKPEEKHEVTENELFLLFHEKPLGPIDEAETPKMLYDLKSIVDKESKITEVEIHQSNMGSLKSASTLFHVFNVFRTTSESDGDYWWSLEKNLECLVLQRSRNKDDVRKKLYGKERKKVKSIVENLGGKGSIKDLLEMFLSHKVIREIYNITDSNCQSLVSFVSKQITEISYQYDGWEFGNVWRVENLHILTMETGVTEWPTLFNLIYSENTDLVDKMIESGKYDINAVHGGITPLHFAIILEKTEMVKHLLKDPINADPTTRDSKFGRNALHWLVINTTNTETIDLLLAHPKVKVDDVDEKGRTALHWAARASHVIAVPKLLEKGANPNVRDKEGLTPLHLAALYGTKKIIDLILQARKDKQNHVDDDKTKKGSTALHYAAASSNEGMVKHLINKGADLHCRDNDGDTPLHEAAIHAKNLRIIDFFLRKTKDTDMLYQYRNDVQLLYNAYRNENLLGAEIVARINRKGKPISWADKILEVLRRCVIEIPAKLLLEFFKEKEGTNFSSCLEKLDRLRIERAKNDQEIDEILKEGKFDINSRDKNGDTPLLVAIGANNVIAVERLLEGGADPTLRDKNGLTPIQVAATRNKDLEILDLLLATGKVDINDGGQSGYTLLHFAMARPDVTAIYFLLSNGAKPNVADQNGATPLHVAAYCLYTLVLGLILETKQVDINRRDNNGKTALHYAVRGKRVDNVRYLLENGADPAIRDENGDTPVQVAGNNDSEIFDLFLASYKVDINDGGQSGYRPTLLHLAMAASNVTAARYLLSKGANPNAADQNGTTPLHVAACCATTTDVLGLILEKEKVDINRRDNDGQTALHLAVGGKRVDNVRYLLEKGADPAISDENGLTPYQVAAAAVNQDSAILDLLRPNENKTEIGEGNNAEDMENVELPPSQEDVVDVNSLDNSGAQQHIQGQSEDISNPLKDAAEDGNPCDEFKVKFPRKLRAALDGQDSTQ